MATIDFAELGAYSPQLQSPGQVTTGNVGSGMDWNALMIALGQAGQAFSAEEPQSWQHQLGKASSGWGQSKKMAQAAQKQSAQRKLDWEWLRSIMTGETPMTPQGMEGVSKMEMGKVGSTGMPEMKLSVTPSRDIMEDMFGLGPLQMGGGASTTAPTAPTGTQGELADISPFSISPTGISAADLVGLSPEQILAVMGEQRAAEQFRTGTFMDAMGLLGQMTPKPTEQWATFTDPETGRIFRRSSTTGKVEQVSGALPTPSLTFEQRKELAKIPTDIPRGGYWAKGDDTMWVASGQNPPAGYTQVASGISPLEMARLNISLENLGLSKKRAEFAKQRAATTAAQNVRMNPKNEAIKADIQFYNENAPDSSPVGFIWFTQTKKWAPDINEAVEVPLPLRKDGTQVTMADIRADAKERGITVEAVLKEFYDWQLEQQAK
jgi:hypothetical protein